MKAVKEVGEVNVRYRSTKLPSYVFDEAELARAKLITGGIKRLPKEVLAPEKCPICGSKMRGFEVRTRVSYYVCDNCGYKQPGINVDVKGTDIASLATGLGLGVLLGLGLAALIYLVTRGSGEKQEEQ